MQLNDDTSKPHLIITIGIPGAGKSYFAEKFAKTFKAPIISHQIFKSITQDDRIANKCVVYMLNEALKTGHTVIYDGQADSLRTRSALIKKAAKSGYAPLIIWIQTDKITASNRFKRQNPSITKKQFNALTEKFEPPVDKKDLVVISGKYTYENQLKIALKKLSEGQEV